MCPVRVLEIGNVLVGAALDVTFMVIAGLDLFAHFMAQEFFFVKIAFIDLETLDEARTLVATTMLFDLDLARRTLPLMTGQLAGVLSALQYLLAGQSADRQRVGTGVPLQISDKSL